MAERIDYNFLLSKSVCSELEEISRLLRQNAETAERDNLCALVRAWQSDASQQLAQKYAACLAAEKQTAVAIEKEIESIRLLSRRLYLIEEAAKKAATERGAQG